MHFSSFIRTVFLTFVISHVLADNFDVTVGKDGQLAFNPPTVNLLPGSTVTYHFYAKVRPEFTSSFYLELTFDFIEPLGNSVLVRRPMPSVGRRFLLGYASTMEDRSDHRR